MQTARLSASDEGDADFFGISVDLQGDQALIDAWQHRNDGITSGAMYVFEKQLDGSW